MSRLRLIAAAALALVIALPGTALAAAVDVTGTVTAADGTTPVPGVEVAILVQGTDEIYATTTDAAGAWTIPLDLEPGDVLEVNATGETTRSEPDGEGCITVATPTAQVEVTVGETALEPVTVVLDGEISSKVCSATATPDTAAPAVTPPSTDTGATGATASGGGILVVVGLLALVIALAARFLTPRRAGRVPTRD